MTFLRVLVLCWLSLAPVEIGGGYARDFNAVFPALARAHGVTLYPDLLDGVARRPTLNQADGIHPNARGAALITLERVDAIARVTVRRGTEPARWSAASVATVMCSASTSNRRRSAPRVSERPKPSVPSETKSPGIHRATRSGTAFIESLAAITGPSPSPSRRVT